MVFICVVFYVFLSVGEDPRHVSLDYSVAHSLEAVANCLGKPVR